MFFVSPKKPNPPFPPKNPLENGYDMLRLFLGLGPPQQSDDRPLFQGLLYEPPVGKGLLNIPDPDAGRRLFPGANALAPARSIGDAPQQFPRGDLRAVTASLSHSALPPPRIAPEPQERDAMPALPSNSS